MPDTFKNLYKKACDQTLANIFNITNTIESFIIRAIEQTSLQYADFQERFLNMISNANGIFLSLQEMCEKMHFSKTHLERLVNNEFHCGAIAYCLNIKLEKSCLLLQETNLPIKEISEELKFCDTAHYSKTFKEKFGVSPLQYRKERQQSTTRIKYEA